MRKVVDLTGQVFGRLTVLRRDYEKENQSKYRDSQWFCKCSCGKTATVLASRLKNGNTKSCGCLQLIGRNEGNNTYDLTGDYGIGYTSKGEPFYFDLEDYNRVKEHCWYMDNKGYVITRIKKRLVLQHRFVMNANEEDIIDHIYAKTNDNRKSELRLASKAQNCQNSKIPTNNTSGVKGVTFNKSAGSWGYEIWCNNKRERKYGLTFEEAVKARKEAEIRLHKEFRRM